VKKDEDRARRLAAALRENLRRRKAQAREADTVRTKVEGERSERGVDGADGTADPLHRPSAGPPPRPGED